MDLTACPPVPANLPTSHVIQRWAVSAASDSMVPNVNNLSSEINMERLQKVSLIFQFFFILNILACFYCLLPPRF